MTTPSYLEKHAEHILCISAGLAEENRISSVLTKIKLADEDLVSMQRKKLELDPNFRQLLPYAVISCKGKIAVYRRTPKGHENRLHDKLSIGFGGHVESSEIIYHEGTSVPNIEATIKASAQREISEEVAFDSGNKIVGDIKWSDIQIASSLSEVDKVHLGIVNYIEVENEMIESSESQIEILGFYSPSEIEALGDLENWSRIIIQNSMY